MSGKRFLRRAVVCLLIFTLLPFARLAEFAIQPAHAIPMPVEMVFQSVIEDRAHFEWALSDGNYDDYNVTSELYSEAVDDYLPYYVEYDAIAQRYVFDHELSSGNYVLHVIVKDNVSGDEVYDDWVPFAIAEQGFFSVYLFGPDEPIEELKFYNSTTDLNLETTYEKINGYVKYTAYTYADACITLNDGGEGYVFSNSDELCAAAGWEHVVYASKTGYVVDVLDREILVEDGRVSGYLSFAASVESGYFQLNVVSEDNVRACKTIVPNVRAEFDCELFDGDALLSLDYVQALGEYVQTNAVFRLDDAELPKPIGFLDANTAVGFVEPTLQFAGPIDESQIALYEIVPPHKANELPDIVKYKATAETGPYTATFDEFRSYVGDFFKIRMIDKQGREYVKALTVPVIDDMSSSDGILDYEYLGCTGAYTLSWNCESMEPYENFPGLVDPWFEGGSVGWTAPVISDVAIAAYDIYFADDDKIKSAVARVNLEPNHQGAFEYTFSNIPPDAKYAAVVTLVGEIGESGNEQVYYSEPFFIELSEPQQPQQPAMPVIVMDDFVIFGNDGRLYYHVENPDKVGYGTVYSLYRIVNGIPEYMGGITGWGDDGSVIFGNLESGTYRARVILYINYEPLVTFEHEFTIDSLRLNGLKVNGVQALRDNEDPYRYSIHVDWDANEASITAMSPDGVVKIGESIVDTNAPYFVTLDEPETEVTIVVRSPDDQEQIYRLTIVKNAAGEILLWEPSIVEGVVYLNWEVAGETGKPYTTEVKLYRPDSGEEISLSPNDIEHSPHLNFARLYNLQPGTYKFLVRLKSDGKVEDEAYGRFVIIAEPQPVNFYIFGTDQEIGDLMIRAYNGDISKTHASGNGYVRYTIEHIQSCYSVESGTRLISGPGYYCSSAERDFVAHATTSDLDAHLDDIEIRTWDAGLLEGALWFYWFGNWEIVDDYRLVVADWNGAVYDNVCTIDKPDSYEDYDYGLAFTCSGIPENAKYLRIDALIDQVYVPTNMVIRIDQVELPDNIGLVDADPRPGWLDLTVRFGKSADESEIALYKLITPRHAGVGSTYTAMVEANGEEEPYEVYFGGMETHPGDEVILQAYDRDGYLILNHAARPVIDAMTTQTDLIEYESCYSTVPDCKPSDHYGTYPEPQGARFEDEDPQAGMRMGTIEWTVPDVGPAHVIAYDLYYADANQSIIRGEARVNRIGDGDQFRFRLANVPQAARSVAVVPLLEQGGLYYFADPFYIALDDLEQQEPEPDELVEGSEFVKLEDGSYGYVPRGMTAGALIAKFRFVSGTDAVVMDGDDPLDSDDTVTPGSRLVLTLAARREEIELRFLAELLRPSEAETITLEHVAAFVIAQLTAENPVDLTGDGEFDGEDVRLLLGELEN